VRTPLTLIFIFCLSIGQMPFGFGQSRVVDIDSPGALDALARDNPRHYRRVVEIMSDVQRQADSEVPRWMRTRFEARDVAYGPLLLVTHPPKRHLAFTIDEVRYKAIVTLTNWKPQPIPAK
jgi:hypothetical protein